MTITDKIPPAIPQHLLLDDVSWDYYERTLDEIGDRPMRVTFFRGRMEIMSPLTEHERSKKAIARLVEMLAFERDIALFPLGSTTFRREDKKSGLEPDECYYLRNESSARGMQTFDATADPPPDLAIEIDITRSSIPREPIYAALGIPELWRYDGSNLSIRLLTPGGSYITSTSSPTFPFLPISQFLAFVHRMEREPQNVVLRDFQQWVNSL